MTAKSITALDQRIGQRIKARRNAIGMSQEKLAHHLGVTFQQVQKYEKAANRIPVTRLMEIARLFDVPITYFLEEAENV